MSFDGFEGTGIRAPTIAAQRRGLVVISAAPGVVKAARDGEVERDGGPMMREEVAGRECGNGVVVTHSGGWETQYCHMARGSVLVRPGQSVQAGTDLGRVGLSGWTEFPHLGFSVRQGVTKVDPFTGDAAACGQPARPLWTPAALSVLSYSSPQVINAGFAGSAMDEAALEAETLPLPARTSPLMGYVRAIGLNAGDRLTLTLHAPDGRELATIEQPPLDRAKAQHLLFAGAPPPDGAWPAGRYRLTYVVVRGGQTVLNRTAETVL